jgi:hypothetical protein
MRRQWGDDSVTGKWCLVFFQLIALSFAQLSMIRISLGQNEETVRNEVRLKTFLQGYVKESAADYSETSYYNAFVDLDKDGKQEAIVYLAGNGWCGSSGCHTLILKPESSSYRIVTDISATYPPIRVFDRVAHGWQSVGVWTQGGGIIPPGYESESAMMGILTILWPARAAHFWRLPKTQRC